MNIFAHFSLKFDRYSNFIQIYKHFMLWYVVTNEKIWNRIEAEMNLTAHILPFSFKSFAFIFIVKF